jgi:hypothetical protein
MPATFGDLRDLMEEALHARDHGQWCRLFDFYRRSLPQEIRSSSAQPWPEPNEMQRGKA